MMACSSGTLPIAHLQPIAGFSLDQAGFTTLPRLRSGLAEDKKMIQSTVAGHERAKKYQITCKTSAAISLEDLLQGCLGLNRAAEKFDLSAGYRFSISLFLRHHPRD